MENTRKSKWVIHYSADDYWNSNPHSRHHITDQFYKDYKILWVNPMGSRVPSMKKKGFWGRVFRKLKSLAKFIKQAKKGFFVTTFITVPVFKEGRIQKVNQFMLKAQLWIIKSILGIRKPILFYTTPVYANTLGLIKHSFAVYYYSDQYTAYREFDEATRKFTEKLDEKLYSNVDLVLCASTKIYNNVVDKTTVPVKKFPHQVDYKFFSEYQAEEKPEDIRNLKRPIVGYYGTLSDSNDWEIIKYCAELRPEYNFVFIGRKDIKDTGLENFKNVHFLGKKPFDSIPAYGKCFDVAIMFWIRREWIINCSPLKLKEYLSMGIPVVSTEIEEITQNYPDVVHCGRDRELFLLGLDLAIKEKDEKKIAKGIDKVKDDNWYNAIKIVEEEMKLKERANT